MFFQLQYRMWNTKDSHMGELTLSGGLNTEGGGQTEKRGGRMKNRIEKHIVGWETHKREGKWQHAQIRLLWDRLTDLTHWLTDLLTDSRILRIDANMNANVEDEKIWTIFMNWNYITEENKISCVPFEKIFNGYLREQICVYTKFKQSRKENSGTKNTSNPCDSVRCYAVRDLIIK